MSDGIVTQIVILIVLTLAGAFFSAAETALSYCNQVRIRLMADNGDKRARRCVKLLESFDETVVTLLIGVNIMHVLAASLATVLFVSVMKSGGPAMATAVMTLVTFIFGETIPKNIARANADAYILASSGFIRLFAKVTKPAVFVLTATGEGMKKLFKVKVDEPSMTEDEFAAVVESVQEDGLLEENETEIIVSSMKFADVPASSVMTPREKVVFMDVHATAEEAKDLILAGPFSRYPVCNGSLDAVEGVLVSRKFLYKMARGEEVDVKSLMEEPLLVPVSVTANEALQEMRRRSMHFAVLITDEGKTAGVLTMDDCLEELVDEVGQIHEENAEPADLEEEEETK